MKQRCLNPRSQQFKNYGARGIKVCDRWRDSFKNFFADMGSRPSPSHSLDRRENTSDYTPENCRWATALEQNRNTRWNRTITIEGETRCLTEWLELRELSRSGFRRRLARGMTEAEALNVPKVVRGYRHDGSPASKGWPKGKPRRCVLLKDAEDLPVL